MIVHLVTQTAASDHTVAVSRTILQVVATLGVVWLAGAGYVAREMNRIGNRDTEVESFRGLLLMTVLIALWFSGVTLTGAAFQVAISLGPYVGPHLSLTLMEIAGVAAFVVFMFGYSSWKLAGELEQKGVLRSDIISKAAPFVGLALILYFGGGIIFQIL